MDYIFLIYANEHAVDLQAQVANDAALLESGYLLAAVHLQNALTAACLQVENGQIRLSERTFTRPAEQLSALYVIHARDLNEACRVAAKLPQAHRGPIEIRSIAAITGQRDCLTPF